MLQNREAKNFEYIAHISKKLNIDPNEFSKCILKAWKNKRSECKDLITTCRVEKGEAYFLFIYKDRILCQLPLPIKILQVEEWLEYCMKTAMRQAEASRWRSSRDTK